MGNIIHRNTGIVLTTDWNSHKESCSTEESVFTNSSLASQNVTAFKREVQSTIKILHVSNRKHQKNIIENKNMLLESHSVVQKDQIMSELQNVNESGR